MHASGTIERDPNELIRSARVLLLAGEYKEAVEKCQEAIQIDGKDAYAYNILGLALASQEHYDEGIEQYRQADALYQEADSANRKFALSNWGDALRQAKRYDEAVAKIREAIGIDAKFASTYNV